MFPPWSHKRRFNSYAEYFKELFGERVQKVAIDAGFTCPNRDGTLGTGGCTFCNNDAFNPSYCSPLKSITQQIEEGIEFHRVRYRRAKKFLAYFQAYSNTYGSLKALKEKYEEALGNEQIMGLVIGTRPDCIDDEKLDYFSKIAKNKYVIIEYGIESCYDTTLKRIHRGHTFEQSRQAIIKTSEYGIHTGAHIIFGLPGETREDMLNSAQILSELPLNNLKIHQLQIIKNTALAREYEKNPDIIDFIKLSDYIDLVIDFLERLRPTIVLERFTGEAPPRFLAGPGWGLIRADQILQMIEKRLGERNTWQGKYYRIK